jgi:hypothetical protein
LALRAQNSPHGSKLAAALKPAITVVSVIALEAAKSYTQRLTLEKWSTFFYQPGSCKRNRVVPARNSTAAQRQDSNPFFPGVLNRSSRKSPFPKCLANPNSRRVGDEKRLERPKTNDGKSIGPKVAE